MSESGIAPAAYISEAINCPDISVRSPTRRSRIPGKGRRRRAAAEQRRTEHEIWRHFVQNVDDDIYVVPPPPPISRRQLRRAARRLPNVHVEDGDANDDDHLAAALANFLSLLETPYRDSPSTHVSTPHSNNPLTNVVDNPHVDNPLTNVVDTPYGDNPLTIVVDSPHGDNSWRDDGVNIPPGDSLSTSIINIPPDYQPLDMSYESLGMLEDVKCTAPVALVLCLCGHIFDKENGITSSFPVDDERCTICQMEFMSKDSCMLLPCLHLLHDGCGSEWFLKHSKLCPVCKRDITEQT